MWLRTLTLRMPIWAWIFCAAFGSTIFTGLIAIYLDLRRWNLVGAGHLPSSTPEIFYVPRSAMGKAAFGWIAINWGYVFSRAMIRSPDQQIRRFAPVLRVGLISSPLLGLTSMLVAIVTA